MAVDGVVPDEHDRAGGDDVVEQEPSHGAPDGGPRPRGTGEDAAVVGRVTGGEVAEGAEDVGDGPPAGRQDGPDQEDGEPLVGRAGELEGEHLDEGVGLGW